MDTSIVRRWVLHKQQHYKSATRKHLEQLQSALARDTQQRIQRIDARSITICIDLSNDAHKTELAGISINRLDVPGARLNERVILISNQSSKTCQNVRGKVTYVDLEEVRIKLDEPLKLCAEEDGENPCKLEYKLQFDKQHILDRRNCVDWAIKRFSKISCSPHIHKCILGIFDESMNIKFSKSKMSRVEGIIQPRNLQSLAVDQSMRKRISLVEGVAGAGKTVVAANIACSMSRLRKRKILLCSPLKSTINKMTDILKAVEGVTVVKIGEDRQTKPKHSKGIDTATDSDCTLKSLVQRAIYTQGWNRSRRALDISRNHRTVLHRQASRAVQNSSLWLQRRVEQEILRKADIVCCTLLQAGSPLLRGVKFDMLIIDDSQVSSELDCLVPMMMKGLKQVTLLSDMRRDIRLARSEPPKSPNSDDSSLVVKSSKISQLSPRGSLRRPNSVRRLTKVPTSSRRKKAEALGLDQIQDLGGLFERWLSLGQTAVGLKHQYRMHETLATFAGHHFYLSLLKIDPVQNDELTRQIFRDLVVGDDRFSWLPNPRCLTAMFDVNLEEESGDQLRDAVASLVDKLVGRENIDKSRIGIITNLHDDVGEGAFGPSDVDVGTVADYVGLEKDFVILAGRRRSSERILVDCQMDCDFIESNSALNIAVTRARIGLFIVTDVRSCIVKSQITPCKSWLDMIGFYQANKLVALGL